MNRAFFIFLLGIGVLIIVVAAVLMTITMKKATDQPGELPERFIHDKEISHFDLATFRERRQRVLDEMDADILILSAGAGNDFRYLTGLDERRGIAVITPEAAEKYRLFVTPWDVYTVMWTGEVYGTKGARERFGADAAYALADFDEMLPDMLSDKEQIYIHDKDDQIKDKIRSVLRKQRRQADLTDMAPVLHEHRIFKDNWEIGQLRHAADVTVKAHQYVLETVAPGQAEYEVQAEIEYIFRRHGMGPGFSSIVGSGPNTCLLHHTRNDRVLQDGDLLLMDVGAKSPGGYTADITRTIPVNGKFTPEQKTIYNLVLKANREAEKKMKPGFRMLDCHHHATDILVEGLHEMGLIPDTTKWWQKRFYIQHRLNHFIGLQVHDVGEYDFDTDKRNEHILTQEIRGREIQPGMVMTNEPGLYFMEGLLDGIHEMFGHLASDEELNAFVEEVRPVYEQYEGIGVRIEDDILITDNGNVNLSTDAPKTIEAIERAMK